MLVGLSIPVSQLKEHSDFSFRKSSDQMEHLFGEEALGLIKQNKTK